MNPVKEIFKIKRPKACRSTSVPYVSFGFGFTPGNQATEGRILAIGWDRLI